MFDLKLTSSGDLDINELGDVSTTSSVSQAVAVRLRWFLGEWRLGPTFGLPYYEEVFVKNPNLTKIKFLLRELVIGVEGVSDVTKIEIELDRKTRRAQIAVAFVADGYPENYNEEVIIYG